MARVLRYRLYFDTSVLGALLDEESPDRVRLSRAVLKRSSRAPFEAFVGTLLIEELSGLPERERNVLLRALADLHPTVLAETDATLRLSEAYLHARLLPRRKAADARHIAIATVADLDAIVSWNFKDMVNLRKKRIVQWVNHRYGYAEIDIISPLEVPLDE